LDARPWLIQAEIDASKSPQRRQILIKILRDLETAVSRAATGVAAFLVMGFFGGFPF